MHAPISRDIAELDLRPPMYHMYSHHGNSVLTKGIIRSSKIIVQTQTV